MLRPHDVTANYDSALTSFTAATPIICSACTKTFSAILRSLDAPWQAFFAGFEAARQMGPLPGSHSSNAQPLRSAPRACMTWCIRIASSAIAMPSSIRWGTSEPPIHFGSSTNRAFRSRTSTSTLTRAVFRARGSHATRPAGTASGDLLRHARRRVHGYHRQRAANLAARADGTIPESAVDSRPLRSRRILELLIAAETFEQFLQAKFIGQKRFSRRRGRVAYPASRHADRAWRRTGREEIVMGMTHRGRLNVLAHVLHKPYEIILSEFKEHAAPQTPEGEGDVKYHLGLFRQSHHGPRGTRSTARSAPTPATWSSSTR